MKPSIIAELQRLRRLRLLEAITARCHHRGSGEAIKNARRATTDLLRAEIKARRVSFPKRVLPDMFEGAQQ